MRVEGGERLVHQEHPRAPCERTGKPDPLTLSSRELGRPCLGKVSNPQPVEKLLGAGLPAIDDVLLDRHMREERVLLEDETDAAALGRLVDASRGVEQHVPLQLDPSALRADEAGDRAQDCRLPRARRPDQRDRLATELER